MKESAKNHNINVNINEYNKDENKTFSALLYSNDKVIHIMYIINAESLTNIHICHKCGSYIHKGNNNIERFKNHVKNCNGKFKKDFIPSHEALPYVPHILNNPLYLYCLSYNIEWKPTIHYITYDFETMEKKINKNISDSTTINSKLILLSVASCVKLDKGLITKNFDIRINDFIEKWIDWLFVMGIDVYKDKLTHLKSFIKDKSEDDLNKLDQSLKVITVFGYNSSRFDSNLFREFLKHVFKIK